MTKIDDGGPAFPTEPNTQDGFYAHHGMSLRDWFAGQALAGLIAQSGGTALAGDPIAAARWSYQMADAMLAARKGVAS